MSPDAVFEDLLSGLVTCSGVSRAVLAEVLTRVMVAAPDDVPRADIAKGTMLAHGDPMNPAAVSKAVRALVQDGLLDEDDPVSDERRAGRPIKPLRLGRERWALLGIKVIHTDGRPTGLCGLVTSLRADLAHDVLAEKEQPLPGTVSFNDVAEHIADFAEALVAAARIHDGDSATGEPRKLLAIGVEVAAHVHEGRLIGATHWGLPPEGVSDLAAPLRERLKVPVVVDNDVNVLAVRETYRPEYPERDLALVAVFEDGVGASLILNRLVYRGSGGLAAEPGHQYVRLEGAPPPDHEPRTEDGFDAACHCGHHGHVDCYAVPARLCAELNCDDFDQAAAADARRQGHLTPAGWAFQRGGTALGQGIASLINIVNPARVVVVLPPALANADVDDGTAAAEYRQALEASVTEHSFSTGATQARSGQPNLTTTALSQKGVNRVGAHCAAIRALDYFVMRARGQTA